MEKVKCPECGRVLLWIDHGLLEIKCPRCGAILRIEYDKVTSKDGRP